MIQRFSVLRKHRLVFTSVAILTLASPLIAADPPKLKPLLPVVTLKPAASQTANEAAVRATAKAFVEAFNRGDADAVAAMFTAYASVADDEGQILRGQTAIRDEYARIFKTYPGAKIVVAVKSIEFPTPEMAIEDGVSQISAAPGGYPVGPPVMSRYTVCHVRTGGKWLMASVREAKVAVPSNHAQVDHLGWLVGNWTANRDGKTAESKITWIANKSFLERDYKVSIDGVVISGGKQVIGWDPNAGKIRSWSFDASGGYGTGLWTATGGGWQIQSTGVLSDGTPTSSRDLLIRVPGQDNVLGWRSVSRTMGEVALPDTPEIVLDRIVERKK
jgi:uncharacterized protein (TIGR02246 family)